MPLKVNVLLFGEARDLAGTRSMPCSIKAACTVPDFLKALHEATGARLQGKVLVTRADGTASLAPGYKIMINKQIMSPRETKDIILKDGDEVGILPPFSGG